MSIFSALRYQSFLVLRPSDSFDLYQQFPGVLRPLDFAPNHTTFLVLQLADKVVSALLTSRTSSISLLVSVSMLMSMSMSMSYILLILFLQRILIQQYSLRYAGPNPRTSERPLLWQRVFCRCVYQGQTLGWGDHLGIMWLPPPPEGGRGRLDHTQREAGNATTEAELSIAQPRNAGSPETGRAEELKPPPLVPLCQLQALLTPWLLPAKLTLDLSSFHNCQRTICAVLSHRIFGNRTHQFG